MPSKAKIFSRLAYNVDLVGGVIKIDTVSLTNASMDANTQMAGVNLSTQISSAVPTGTIQSHAASSAPSGWLICDGSAISRTTYSDLYSIVGTTWGSGDGSTTFAIPDLRGAFLRGEGTGTMNSRNKVGGSVGDYQEDQFQGHNHAMRIFTGTATYGPKAGDNYNYASWTSSIQQPTTWSTYGDVRYGNETVPYNASVRYCIKY